jgi:Xaa-Pro aminopeptidase
LQRTHVLDGTIDTTRTLYFGRKPPKDIKRAFTRVLQGHIAVDTAIFPSGTTGEKLDILARQPLWHDLKDFGHGVGHGIGSFLAVHEGESRPSM